MSSNKWIWILISALFLDLCLSDDYDYEREPERRRGYPMRREEYGLRRDDDDYGRERRGGRGGRGGIRNFSSNDDDDEGKDENEEKPKKKKKKNKKKKNKNKTDWNDQNRPDSHRMTYHEENVDDSSFLPGVQLFALGKRR